MAGDVTELVAAVGEALRDRAVHVVRGRARRASRCVRRRGTRRTHRACGPSRRSPVRWPARPRPSASPARRSRATAARSRRAPPPSARSRTRARRAPCSSSAVRSPARRTRARRPPSPRPRSVPGRYSARKESNPSSLIRTLSRTESSSASLFTARARSKCSSNGTRSSPVERAVVADGHDVVEPVDAEAPPAGVLRALRDRVARPVVEDLLDARRPVLPHVARLAGEDDRRLAVGGHARRRRSGARSGSRSGTSRPPRSRCTRCRRRRARPARARPSPGGRCRSGASQFCVHDASTPLISAATASLSGVGTPWSRPKRAMPPLRKSTSVGRRASTSCSIDAL